MGGMMSVQRGDIWRVTVLPITDRGERVYPFKTEVPAKVVGLGKLSKIKCGQIRAVDKDRLVRFMGVLPDPVIYAAERALLLHLGFEGDNSAGLRWSPVSLLFFIKSNRLQSFL
ncbi:MAG: type II toxin-antitoxin system PemK/MazF family toxin [Candidatus Omnitrophota bacterium]